MHSFTDRNIVQLELLLLYLLELDFVSEVVESLIWLVLIFGRLSFLRHLHVGFHLV